MVSKKNLSNAEMDTLTKSCSPTIVITANGEVQTHEEATVYVKEFDIFLTMKVFENTPAVLSLGKLCDEHGYSYKWINGQKPHLIQNGIRIQCNTENFVLIMVPGLSASSSSSSHSSTSMTPSRQEIDRPTSSPSSSTSPPMTSSTVSSASVDRQERRGPCGIDHHPAIVSSERVERQERRDPYSSETSDELLTKPTKIQKPNKNEDHEQGRGDPCHSDILEWLQEFRETLVDDRVTERRDSHASSSHGLSSEPARSEDLGEHSLPTTTVSSDSETRAWEDLSGIDSHPSPVSSSHVQRTERGDPLTKPTKNPKPNKNETTIQNGATRCILKYRNGCKNSEQISWMIEFLNAETHTPVLVMNHL